ncbi:MAG: hypothetical protein LBG80_09645 [Bacteroidales bacterium]|jgi:hypothetical protein|nr:hypothetical protein [Bacteroidales bacterium]
MDNRHSVSVPEDVMEDVKRKAAEIFQILKPYMIPLTPEERRNIIKMGEKTYSFVSKAYDLAKENPDLCPKYFDIEEMRIDVEDAVKLIALKTNINQIYESISDTEMVAGSEAYKAALMFYQEAKNAAQNDIYGAKAIYEELKKRFPTRRKSNNDDSTQSSNNE